MPQGHQRQLHRCRTQKKENCNKEDGEGKHCARWYRANRPKHTHKDTTMKLRTARAEKLTASIEL